MLSPWLVDILAQAVLFVIGCSCCGGKRKPPLPHIETPPCSPYPNIPFAQSFDEEAADWDLVEAEEADTFGLQVRADKMHY